MAFLDFRIIYERSDFLALSGAIPIRLLTAQLLALPLADAITEIRLTGPGGSSVAVQWETLPSDETIDTVDDFISVFAGGATTSEPIELESLDPTNDGTGNLVDKIDFTTQPLDGGTYQVSWASEIQMVAAVAATGVLARFIVTRSDGASRPWRDSWDLDFPHFFGNCITFKVTTGQTIRVQLQFQKLGGAAATAQMSAARVTIDQIASDE